MDSTDSAVAGRWFEVRAEYQRFSRWRTFFGVIQELLLWLVTFGFGVGEFDPKRFCDVMVLRRDNGDVVEVYSYDRLGDASAHFESLQDRLADQHVYDFCRDLGLSPHLVEGLGSEEARRDPAWIAISRSERRKSSV